MTPKEKAIELVTYFMNIKPVKLSDYSRIYQPTSKILALKVVSEIIESRKSDKNFDDTKLDMVTHYIEPHQMYLRYWLKVIEEIENL